MNSDDVKYVRLEFADIYGASRSVFVTKEYCISLKDKGLPMDLAILVNTADREFVEDTGFGEEFVGSDAYLYPDLSTYQQLPWLPDTASVLGDVRLSYNDPQSSYVPIYSRGVCQRAVNKLNNMGFSMYGSFENEFYPFHLDTGKPFFEQGAEFQTRIQSKCEGFVKDIYETMGKFNITPLKFHAEYPVDLLEITYKPSFGLQIGDDSFRFKQIVKGVGKNHNLHMTFMSKPGENFEHAVGHFNHSIWSKDGETNLFSDATDKQKLSMLTRHWVAGLQEHANALFGLLIATPNCLEDLYMDYFVYPKSNVWGIDNRSVCYRVKNLDATNTYVENRFMRSSFNPYLCVAAHIYAGMDGINRKLELQKEPYIGNADELLSDKKKLPDNIFTLPTSLEEGLKALESDQLFNDELGSDFIKCFATMKRFEIKLYEEAKDKGEDWDWQMKRYFPYL